MPIKLDIDTSNTRTPNQSSRRGAEPSWIVVHYTGVACQFGTDTARYMRRAGSKVSAHFVVDHKSIIQVVPVHMQAWHVGSGQPDKRYERVEDARRFHEGIGRDFTGNRISIGVELCVEKAELGKHVEDKDWFFDQDTIVTAALLIAMLMQRYHIDTSHLIRHMDATGKPCPRPFVSLRADGNAQNDHEWQVFKLMCGQLADGEPISGRIIR